MTTDDIKHTFLWLSDADIHEHPQQAAIQAQGRAFLTAALQRFVGKSLPDAVELLFVEIRYAFFGGVTLQCAIGYGGAIILSDPRLWPGGDGYTIAMELKAFCGL